MLRVMTQPAETRDDEPAQQARSTRDLLPQRLARTARRLTLVIGLCAVVVILFKFETRWVPAGMNTVDGVPGGSWVVLDRWCSGLQVGSEVFVSTPHGDLVSRIASLSNDEVTIQHPNADATWGDSRHFGALPRERVLGTIVVAFAPAAAEEVR